MLIKSVFNFNQQSNNLINLQKLVYIHPYIYILHIQVQIHKQRKVNVPDGMSVFFGPIKN